jgi:aspartate racemase
MPQHIGIVACSAEGAALCYRTVCVEGAQLLGAHNHPEVSLHGHSLADYMNFIRSGDWAGVAELMMSSAEKLARAGADFLICPDNTIHQAFDLVAHRSPRPWLHIAQEVACEAKRNHFKRIAVLGTRYLMEGPVYPEKLKAAGLEYRMPGPPQRERIDQIIMDELVMGQFLPRSRAYFTEVIRGLKDEGCDAVALACTEVPLIVDEESSPLPPLDSTRLLARAALRNAVSG